MREILVRENPFTPYSVEWYVEKIRNGLEEIYGTIDLEHVEMVGQLINDTQGLRSLLQRRGEHND